MPTRTEVYAAIRDERRYQDEIWQHRCNELGVPCTPDNKKPVEEWLVYIRGYYQEAIREASHVAEGGKILDIVRKLAGLCVACMENNGGWVRQLDGSFGTYYPGRVPRHVIFYMIDNERRYQDSRTDVRQHTINGYLVMFGTYLDMAFDAWTGHAGDSVALKNLVKLAGIVVHCMEDHGAPWRTLHEGSGD